MFTRNQIKFINKFKYIGLYNVLICSGSLKDFQEELRYLSGEIWDENSIVNLIREIHKKYNCRKLNEKITHLFFDTQWFTKDGRRVNE